jgi:hypothetical protein
MPLCLKSISVYTLNTPVTPAAANVLTSSSIWGYGPIKMQVSLILSKESPPTKLASVLLISPLTI